MVNRECTCTGNFRWDIAFCNIRLNPSSNCFHPQRPTPHRGHTLGSPWHTSKPNSRATFGTIHHQAPPPPIGMQMWCCWSKWRRAWETSPCRWQMTSQSGCQFLPTLHQTVNLEQDSVGAILRIGRLDSLAQHHGQSQQHMDGMVSTRNSDKRNSGQEEADVQKKRLL